MKKKSPMKHVSAVAPVSDHLKDRLHSMPKFELHVHVEGAADADTYFSIAQKNNISLPVRSRQEWQRFFEFRDFPHFIEVYLAAVGCLQSTGDYGQLIDNFFKHQAEQNILYTEAYLSATFIVEQFDDEDALDAIEAAVLAGQEKYGCVVNLIPDIARMIPESQQRVLEFVIKGKQRGLFIGIGLGGVENGFPPSLFTETYEEARRAGLRTVAHAGEADGPESIWGAIDDLKVERIGHGVRCIEDPALVDALRVRQIPLEVCPVSNYCLGIVKQGEKHPIREMFDAGLNCCVNSDDPAMFSTSLVNEYEMLASSGFDWPELRQLNLNAMEAAFLNDTEKNHYRDLIRRWESALDHA
jgi:adenosine deaminase